MFLDIIYTSYKVLYATAYSFGTEVIGLVKNKPLIVPKSIIPIGTVDEYYPQNLPY